MAPIVPGLRRPPPKSKTPLPPKPKPKPSTGTPGTAARKWAAENAVPPWMATTPPPRRPKETAATPRERPGKWRAAAVPVVVKPGEKGRYRKRFYAPVATGVTRTGEKVFKDPHKAPTFETVASRRAWLGVPVSIAAQKRVAQEASPQRRADMRHAANIRDYRLAAAEMLANHEYYMAQKPSWINQHLMGVPLLTAPARYTLGAYQALYGGLFGASKAGLHAAQLAASTPDAEGARLAASGGALAGASPAEHVSHGGLLHLGATLATGAANVVGKIAVEAAGAITQDPYHGTIHTAKDAWNIMSGTTQMAGALSAMANPTLPYRDREHLAEEMVKGALTYYKTQYLDKGWGEAFHEGRQHPVQPILDIAALAVPGSKALTIGNYIRKGGRDINLALDMLKHGPKLGPRMLHGRIEGGGEIAVEKRWARTPMWRGTQRAYDLGSRLADKHVATAKHLPFSMQNRAWRAWHKNYGLAKRRGGAEAARLYGDIEKVIREPWLGPRSEPLMAALSILSQMPEGITRDEWMKAATRNLRNMIDSGEFITAEERQSASVQRLLKSIDTAEKKSERGLVERRHKMSTKIAQEQDRLANVLHQVNGDRHEIRASMREVNADPSLSDAERQAALAEHQQQLKALDGQSKVVRQELEAISVDQEPISSAARNQLEGHLRENPNFTDEEIQSTLAVGDQVARHMSARSGETPSQWWDRREFRNVNPEDIPEAAFGQERPALPPELPPSFNEDNFKSAVRGIYDRYKGAKGAMPPQVKNAAGYERMAREQVRLAEKGASGKDWYTWSGRRIKDVVGDDWDAAVKISMAVAYLSRTDSVTSNVGHALRAYRNWLIDGDVGRAGRYPNVSRAKLNEIFRTGDWGGYKTNAFFRNILEEVDKSKYDEMFAGEKPATIDRWIVRAMGFTDDSVSQAGRYKAAQELVQHLADQYGWTPKQAQAAIWVAVKSEHEGTDVGRASVHIGTGIDRVTHQLRMNYEATPGNTYDGFPEYATWPEKAKLQFSRRVALAVQDYMRQLRIPHTRGDEGPGLYEPPGGPVEFNPAQALNVRVGSAERLATIQKRLEPGEEALRVSPAERAYYDGVASGIGRALKQNAMPWLRLLVPENKADETATFVSRANLTKADMEALNAAKGADWQIAIGHGDGGVWFNLVKDQGLDADTFQRRVEEIVDSTFGPDAEAVDYAHEGGYIENDWGQGDASYEAKIRDSGRPEEIGAASDALAHQYESARAEFGADPAGAADRARAAELRGARAAGVEPPPAVLHQARRSDILGAAQLLDGPAGQRIIYLTRNADVSTVLHELVGHAADEFKRYYPAEFAPVEEAIGRPLEEWTRADHEQFATWAERYFLDGKAPTPELVNAMQRIKASMRSIYGGIRGALGGDIPIDTRVLFDTVFGAYDDPTVARISLNLGSEEMGLDPYNIEAYGHYASLEKTKLETLQKRLETTRKYKTVEGMQERLDELKLREAGYTRNKKGEVVERRGGATGLTDSEEELRVQLSAKIVAKQALDVLRADKREALLSEKLLDLEKGWKMWDADTHDGAVVSMHNMSDAREEILKDVFGKDFEQLFSNRRDLLANFLVDAGLLTPDFVHGTGAYFPSVSTRAYEKAPRAPGAPASAVMSGKVNEALANLSKQNNMILWQQGGWMTDPKVLLQSLQKAQSLQWMKAGRDAIWDIAREPTVQEIHGSGWQPGDMIVHKLSTPLDHNLRAKVEGTAREVQAPPTSSTHPVDDVMSGLDGGDNDRLLSSLKRYAENSFIDPNVEKNIDWAAHVEDIRVIPGHVVEAMLGKVSGPRGKWGKRLDFVTALARWSLIYANLPAYIIGNTLGNTAFMVAGARVRTIPHLVQAAKHLWSDRDFALGVYGEVGELPLEAVTGAIHVAPRRPGLLPRVQRRTQLISQGMLTVAQSPDRWMRAAVWVDEAMYRGHKTPAAMKAVIAGKTAKAEHERALLQDLTTSRMVDFDRLTETEKYLSRNLLFVYPWIRGATAWPFWYAKHYPIRAAVIAGQAQQWEQRRKDILGDVPPWYSSLVPITENSKRPIVLNAGPISPTSTAAQSIQLLEDTIASLLGRKADSMSARLMDIFAPFLRTMDEAATQRTRFGQDESLLDVLKKAGPDTMIPGWRLGHALMSEQGMPKIYTQAGFGNRFMHTFFRIEPEEISLKRLNLQAQRTNKVPPADQIRQETERAVKAWDKITHGSVPMPPRVRKGIQMQVHYDAAAATLRKKISGNREYEPSYYPGTTKYRTTPSLTEDRYLIKDAVLKYEILRQDLPGADTPSPLQYLADHNAEPGTAHAKLYLKIWSGQYWDFYAGAASRIESDAGNIMMGKQLTQEQAGAAP